MQIHATAVHVSPNNYGSVPSNPTIITLQPSLCTSSSLHPSLYYSASPRTIIIQSSQVPVGYEVNRDGSVVVPTTESLLMFCPYEGIQVVTTVERSPGCMAYLSSLFLCLIGCGVCFCLPFCAKSCQEQVHRCPSCRRVLAIAPA